MEHLFILVLEERDLPNYLKFPNLLRVLIGEHLLLEKMVELRVIRGQHSEPVIGELSDSVIHPRYNRRLPCTFVKQRNFTEVMRWRYKLNIWAFRLTSSFFSVIERNIVLLIIELHNTVALNDNVEAKVVFLSLFHNYFFRNRCVSAQVSKQMRQEILLRYLDPVELYGELIFYLKLGIGCCLLYHGRS